MSTKEITIYWNRETEKDRDGGEVLKEMRELFGARAVSMWLLNLTDDKLKQKTKR